MGKRTRNGRLSIKKETLRRLQGVTEDELGAIAGAAVGYTQPRTAKSQCVCNTDICPKDL
jgi:hypothetical protein